MKRLIGVLTGLAIPAAVLVGFPMVSHAQQGQFLSKSEVEAIANGKKWNHVRAQDQGRITWDLQGGGALYAHNHAQNRGDRGTWGINDQGQLCVKWQGRSQNRCVAVRKDGNKLAMVDSNDLSGTYAELTVE